MARKKRGRPEKDDPKVQLPLRVEWSLRSRIKDLAKAEGVAVAVWCRRVLSKAVDKAEARADAK